MRTALRSALATFLCLTLSLLFAGSAVAQKSQSQDVNVTINSFTTLNKVSTSGANFVAGESEFLNSLDVASGESKDWGSITIDNSSNNNNITLQAQSNQGQFYVDAKVTEKTSTGGLESATLKLKKKPSKNVTVNSSSPTINKGTTEKLITRSKAGAMQFEVRYTEVTFNGDKVGDSNFTVEVNYTVTQSAPGGGGNGDNGGDD